MYCYKFQCNNSLLNIYIIYKDIYFCDEVLVKFAILKLNFTNLPFFLIVKGVAKWRETFPFCNIDPLGRPTVPAGNDHYFAHVRTFPTFQNIAKQTNFAWKWWSLLVGLCVWPRISLMTHIFSSYFLVRPFYLISWSEKKPQKATQ